MKQTKPEPSPFAKRAADRILSDLGLLGNVSKRKYAAMIDEEMSAKDRRPSPLGRATRQVKG